MGIELSIVILASQEKENLTILIPLLKSRLEKIGVTSEIIIVDNDSRDGSRELSDSYSVRYIIQRFPGYGGALKTAFTDAKGEYVLTLDADLSHSPDFIHNFWAKKDEADVLIASRYIKSGKATMPFIRLVLSKILNLFYRKILAMEIRDLSSGYRMYRSALIKNLEILSQDFDALQEILTKIYNAGWKIKELPFEYIPRKYGKSKVKLLHFAFAYLKNIFKMWKLRHSVSAADYDFRAYNSLNLIKRYWQRKRYAIISGFIKNFDKVLDIGCGSASFIIRNPNVIGIDPRINVLRFDKNNGCRVACGSLERLPVKDGKFDAVVCSEVVEHIPVNNVNFKEFNRVLSKNGIFVIGTPDYGKIEWRFIEYCYKKLVPLGYASEHINRYTFSSLLNKLQEYGFTVEGYKYILNGELIIKAKKIKDFV